MSVIAGTLIEYTRAMPLIERHDMYHLETREWRDTTYGNSYASARLFVDYGTTYELVAVFPFQYGRGYDFGHAVHDIVGEMPVTHSREVIKREAKSYGELTVFEAINFTPQAHPSFRLWIDPAIIEDETQAEIDAFIDTPTREDEEESLPVSKNFDEVWICFDCVCAEHLWVQPRMTPNYDPTNGYGVADFSKIPCYKCETALHGQRFRMALWLDSSKEDN